MLPDVWGTMDGLKVTIEALGDFITQSRFYNGWECDHFVTSVLCFASDSVIPAASFNLPGCSHDSIVAEWGGLYAKFEKVYDATALKFVIDSAFSSSDVKYLIKSLQDFMMAGD